MTTLWLIRHGETDWNVEQRFQGVSDQPLNQRGESQAASLATNLSKMSFAGIYSSDLKRVQRTATLALNGKSDGITLDVRLREFDFGSWEGLSWNDAREKFSEDFELWADDREQNPHGGERLSDVKARVETFLTDVRERYSKEDHVLIFSHGGTLGVLICLLMGNDPNRWWQYRFQNCTINEIIILNRGAVLSRLNDDRHLPGK